MKPIDITGSPFAADIVLNVLERLRGDHKTVTRFVAGVGDSQIELEVRIVRVGSTKLPVER